MVETSGQYWAHCPPEEAPIAAWVEQFHRDGYLFLKRVLTPEMCALLRGEPPTNIRLSVTHFTCNYYLTDVTEDAPDGTEVIPGSHLFGASPPPVMEGSKWEPLIAHNVGPAGSVVMFNNQVWHHGGLNTSNRVRYVTQVTYARRIVGHKFYNG